MKQNKAKSRRRAQQRGQAMVEYSMINWLLVVALVLGVTVRIIPPAPGGNGYQNVIELFLKAYQTYYDSLYFVLNSPFP
jgi:hypothetical protein